MEYTNAEAIKAGYPKSAILPGSKFWKKAKAFKSNTSIINFDPVTTSKSGSKISLEAAKPDFSGDLGNISLLKGAVRMSSASDYILTKCTNTGLSSGDSAFNLLNPEWLNIPAALDLGNGNNSVLAGLGYAGWNTGISLDAHTRLLSGTGKDIIRGGGKETGISVGGTISTGAGDDVVEGVGTLNHGITSENGTIDMGDGNDRLIGIPRSEGGWREGNYLNGWIDMGGGNDEITGSGFRFNGPYKVQLGGGNDRLTAPLLFSNTPIDFGTGIDKLYLPPGQYTVIDQGEGGFSLLSATLSDGQPTYGAERISGLELLVSSQTGTEYAFTTGAFVIA